MTLLDKITFEGKHYFDLKSNSEKQKIQDMAHKLKPLEHQIINDPHGEIMISKTGNTAAFSFEENLSDEITKLLTQ